MSIDQPKSHVIVIGAGFTGLAAAYEMSRKGYPVTLLEKDDDIGGLAQCFNINGQPLEKFYHHLFNNDRDAIRLVKELGQEDQLLRCCPKTGVYLDNRIFNLSTPFDLLKFTPLSFLSRIQLGLLFLKVRRLKDWRKLESVTAENWLKQLCGIEVFKVVWEPLLCGKFGPYASQVGAVWLWNKLLLRGHSRSNSRKEELLYYRNSFSALAEQLANKIRSQGGTIKTGVAVEGLIVEDCHIKGVQTPAGSINAQTVIATPALPIVADLLKPHVPENYISDLKKIKYLANVCVILELSNSLSNYYWLNINEPDFPFVGLIEHTNLQSAENYANNHIVYLSKYLPENAKLYHMDNNQILEFTLPYLKHIFPKFDKSWINRYHVFKARYAQPVVECNYSQLIPSNKTPLKGFHISTMAQIYPQDRGINYAIRQGREIGRMITD